MRRPVLNTDVLSLARALLAVPPAARARRCAQILIGARRAGAYARLCGRCHPRWGDGSLDAAARRFPLAPEPFWDDAGYLHCLSLAVAAVQGALRIAPDAAAEIFPDIFPDTAGLQEGQT